MHPVILSGLSFSFCHLLHLFVGLLLHRFLTCYVVCFVLKASISMNTARFESGGIILYVRGNFD